MNWIDYSVRKPSAEPKRMLLLRFVNGNMDVYGNGMLKGLTGITHWAEIEQPEPPFEHLYRQPPPDPFEQWWADNNGDLFVASESQKPLIRKLWDAAIAYAKEGI